MKTVLLKNTIMKLMGRNGPEDIDPDNEFYDDMDITIREWALHPQKQIARLKKQSTMKQTKAQNGLTQRINLECYVIPLDANMARIKRPASVPMPRQKPTMIPQDQT